MSFTQNLISARKEKKLSQRALAEKIHISQQAYAQYETGVSSPSPETLLLIANELNVSVDYLLGRKEYNEDLKVALFGGAEDVTDEMWEEAMFAIQLIKQRHNRKKATDEKTFENSKKE